MELKLNSIIHKISFMFTVYDLSNQEWEGRMLFRYILTIVIVLKVGINNYHY